MHRPTVLALYNCICMHVFDQMAPYCPVDRGSFPVRALIGNTQNTNEFQDIPLNVCVADAVRAFGLYIMYIVILNGESVECIEGVTDGHTHKNPASSINCSKIILRN